MSDPTEAALLDRARRGDRRALDALLVKIEPSIHKFGLKLCHDDETAAEVLQETLLTAARNLATFRGDAALSTWLYMVAKSVCIKQRRRSKFAPAVVESLDAAHEGQAAETVSSIERPDHSFERAELGQHLERAIAALEPMYRDVLVLRDVEGLSANEVAEALELSVEAVKSRLHRARTRIRAALAPLLGVEEEAAPGCPDVVALLSQRLEGDVTADTCKQMEEHLAGCPRCTGLCDSLRATLKMCQRVGTRPTEPVTYEIQASVRQAVKDFLARHEAPAE